MIDDKMKDRIIITKAMLRSPEILKMELNIKKMCKAARKHRADMLRKAGLQDFI